MKTINATNFDALEIKISSPEAVRAWSYGEVTNQKPLTIVQVVARDTVYSTREYSALRRIMSVIVVNTVVSDTKVLFVRNVGWR